LSKIDGIFWMKAKRREILQPLSQHHPVLKQLHVGYGIELEFCVKNKTKVYFLYFFPEIEATFFTFQINTRGQS